MTGDQRMELRRAFKLLYCDGLNVSQALEKMRVEFPSGPAREFWEFIEASKRGICRHDPGIDYTSAE